MTDSKSIPSAPKLKQGVEDKLRDIPLERQLKVLRELLAQDSPAPPKRKG